MKRTVSYLCALFYTLTLMTSCDSSITPDTMAGTYDGVMDIKFNIPGVDIDDVEVHNHVDVTKLSDSNVEVAIDLDLSKYFSDDWAAIVGSSLDFGAITANCLVGPTIAGEASLTGTAKVGDTKIPVTGEYEGKTLDIKLTVGLVTVEFEGTRR